MDDISFIRELMDEDVQVTQDALDFFRRTKDKESLAERVLAKIRGMERKPFFITSSLIREILEEGGIPSPPVAPSISPPGVQVQLESAVQELPTYLETKPDAAKIEMGAMVLRDVTGRSYKEGEIKDFLNVFRDRYDRLGNILRKRIHLQDAVPMGSLRSFSEGSPVKVIGMVCEKRETKGGHVVLELEDLSGGVSAWVFKRRHELMRKAAEVVLDEVIGVEGVLMSGDRVPKLSVRDITWPDLPASHEVHQAESPVCVALISDLHVGSEMFLEDLFMRFVKWLRGEVGDAQQQELASRVKYLVVAGDVVDGVGVYPRQEEELLIDDVYKQYDAAAELLAQIPDHITIIMAPGNHDAVRPSEPQPAIPKDIAKGLYDLNSIMVGNPAWVSLCGVKLLIYHGRSFDDLIAAMPGLTRKDSVTPMKKLLQKRHLAPIYGGRTALSPEQQDYLVIDEIPDIFHCGHMHVYGYDRYRGVDVVNSGTFQGMTIYMRRLGVEPTPGKVPVIDLKTRQAWVIHLSETELEGPIQ